ncbi:MAG: hypothetical protein AAGA48_02260 [Myxococcota bacterium]
MNLSERVAAEHKALVEGLNMVSELSAQSVLETGERLTQVTVHVMELRRVTDQVLRHIDSGVPQQIVEVMREASQTLSRVAGTPDDGTAWTPFRQSVGRLTGVFEQSSGRIESEVDRAKLEIEDLNRAIRSLTDQLMIQTGQAVTALQFQDPAIQHLRRLDSIVHDLRSSIDKDAGSIQWAHRVGDLHHEGPSTPEALASRAKSVWQDTRARVQRFQDKMTKAVSELSTVQQEMAHTVEDDNVIMVAEDMGQRAFTPRSTLDALRQECTALHLVLSGLAGAFTTTMPVDSDCSDPYMIQEDADTTVVVETTAGEVRQCTALLPQSEAINDVNRALTGVSDAMAQLTNYNRALSEVRGRLRGSIAGMTATLGSVRQLEAAPSEVARRLEAPLGATVQAAERLFEAIAESFGFDPDEVEADPNWRPDSAAEDAAKDDDGLILL